MKTLYWCSECGFISTLRTEYKFMKGEKENYYLCNHCYKDYQADEN